MEPGGAELKAAAAFYARREWPGSVPDDQRPREWMPVIYFKRHTLFSFSGKNIKLKENQMKKVLSNVTKNLIINAIETIFKGLQLLQHLKPT